MDYEGDMRALAQDPETQRWWALTDGLQESLVEGAQGSGRDVPWWLVSGLLDEENQGCDSLSCVPGSGGSIPFRGLEYCTFLLVPCEVTSRANIIWYSGFKLIRGV